MQLPRNAVEDAEDLQVQLETAGTWIVSKSAPSPGVKRDQVNDDAVLDEEAMQQHVEEYQVGEQGEEPCPVTLLRTVIRNSHRPGSATINGHEVRVNSVPEFKNLNAYSSLYPVHPSRFTNRAHGQFKGVSAQSDG